MGAIKNNLDPFFQRHAEAFDQGESFGRHAERQEMLPLLKAVSYLLMRTVHGPHTVVGAQLAKVIADIEQPPTPPVTTTPTDDESVNF